MAVMRGVKGEGERRKVCESCGGRLVQVNPYEVQCESCGRKYYVSAGRSHKVKVRMSMGRMIVTCALVVIGVTALAVAGYQFYTRRLVRSASRFSVVFRDFLMEAYDLPIAEIDEEQMARMKYLKIERDKDGYQFTYSYEDFYDYMDWDRYERVLEHVTIQEKKGEFSPTNVQYFTGLTRLELYTEAWENYLLPEDNVIRCIYCRDGLCKYGKPTFFDNVNRETLEEVAIAGAEQLEDFSFLENLKGIKRLTLENAVLDEDGLLEGFDRLEELLLYYVVMDEDRAPELMEEMISLPSMEYFYIEGKTGWYVDEALWEQWQETYGDDVVMVRK